MFVGVNMDTFITHRIVYAIYNNTTYLPDGMDIDHTNRNNFDNSPENLRLISHKENCKNRRVNSNNKTGFPHLYPRYSTKGKPTKWAVCFSINKRMKSFGLYTDIEEAKARVREVSLELYGEFSPFLIMNTRKM